MSTALRISQQVHSHYVSTITKDTTYIFEQSLIKHLKSHVQITCVTVLVKQREKISAWMEIHCQVEIVLVLKCIM